MFQQYLPASRWHRVPPRDHQCRRSPSQARTRTSRAKLSVQVAVRSWLAGRSRFSLSLKHRGLKTLGRDARRMPHSPIRRPCLQPLHLQPLPLPRAVCGLSGYASDACRGSRTSSLGLCGFNGQHRPLLFDSIYPRVPLRECQQPTAFLWRLVSWRLVVRQTITITARPC